MHATLLKVVFWVRYRADCRSSSPEAMYTTVGMNSTLPEALSFFLTRRRELHCNSFQKRRLLREKKGYA